MVEFCGKCGKPNEQGKLCTCFPIKNEEPEILSLEETRQLEVLALEETKELEVLSIDNTEELEVLSMDDTKKLEILSMNNEMKEPEMLSLERTSQFEFAKPNPNNKNLLKSNNTTNKITTEDTLKEKVKNQTNKINFLKQCFSIVINYIKNPVEEIEKNLNSYKMSHILSILIINSLTFGLFTTILLDDILNEFYEIILRISDYISFHEGITLIEIPYIKSILIFSILCFVFINITSFITTIIINKVIRLKTSITKVMKLYGMTSITATITFIICCISSILNTHITPMILFAGMLLNQYYINVTIPIICRDKDNNKLGYAVVISPILVISTIFLLIVCLV